VVDDLIGGEMERALDALVPQRAETPIRRR
jgi:hypothetical protein